MAAHRLTRAEASLIAIRAQLLDARRCTDLLEVVNHLTFLQLDPTAAVAPSADLVLWTRLRDAYQPSQLADALERDRTLYEVRAIVRPTADLPLQLEAMLRPPGATDASVCGTSPNAFTRRSPGSFRSQRPAGSWPSGGCVRSVSRGRRWSASTESGATSRSPASLPRSRTLRATGASTPRTSASPARSPRPCTPR